MLSAIMHTKMHAIHRSMIIFSIYILIFTRPQPSVSKNSSNNDNQRVPQSHYFSNMLLKQITLTTILLGAVNCYQTEDAYPYYQEPLKHHKNSLARQALDGLSSGGAAAIGLVSPPVRFFG